MDADWACGTEQLQVAAAVAQSWPDGAVPRQKTEQAGGCVNGDGCRGFGGPDAGSQHVKGDDECAVGEKLGTSGTSKGLSKSVRTRVKRSVHRVARGSEVGQRARKSKSKSKQGEEKGREGEEQTSVDSAQSSGPGDGVVEKPWL